MDEKTKTLVYEYLKKLLEATEKGVQWTADQIPLIIQEKLNYDFWYSISWMIFGVVLVLGAWLFCHLYEDYANKNFPISDPWKIDQKDARITRVFVRIGSLIVGIGFVTVNGPVALKIAVAPRLYILEWLRGLM